MSTLMESIFEQFVIQLVKHGFIDFEHNFVYGTKIEANANKYTFVWSKTIENYDEKLRIKIKALLQEIHQVTMDGLEDEKLEEKINKVNSTTSRRVSRTRRALK